MTAARSEFELNVGILVETLLAGIAAGVSVDDAMRLMYAEIEKELRADRIETAVEDLKLISAEVDRQLKARMLAGPYKGTA